MVGCKTESRAEDCPGRGNLGRVEENRAKVYGATKATDGNRRESKRMRVAGWIKKRRAQISRNLAGENADTPIKQADKQDKERGKHAEKQRKTAG